MMNWAELESINLIFCTGSPKSGTTFLQMILNNHPEVSCPPEVALTGVLNHIKTMINSINKSFEDIDKKTANQGAVRLEEDDTFELFKFITRLIAYKGSLRHKKQVKYFGLNENEIVIFNKFDLYLKLFPKVKFLIIIRDPRSIAVSSWYHNLRTELGFKEKLKDLNNWASFVAKFWKKETGNIVEFVKKADKETVFICRYEDLVLNPFENYKKIFEFLKVSTDKKVIEKVIDNTSFKKLKDGKFFRKASIDDWKNELSPLAIKEIEQTCGDFMQLFGYKTMYW